MPRYIDADALKDELELADFETDSRMFGGQTVLFEDSVFKIVDSAPTISPDEVGGVVHCRECDLWNRWDSAGRESLGNLTCSCAHWTVEDGAVIRTKPTDFCSYGERMVSEDA